MNRPIATILMPAHNEEAVIARTLSPLCDAVCAGQFRLIVIANGCADATADRARAACPKALVLETQQPGKTHAMNLGIVHVVAGRPVLCLDADLTTTPDALLALVAAIDAGAQAAIGQMTVDVSRASRLVRAHQRAWALNPYLSQGKFGGLFALSWEAAARRFPLPDVTGDDEYIRRSLPAGAVAFVPDCRFEAQSPRSLKSLLSTRRRALRGARQLAAMGHVGPGSAAGSFKAMAAASLTSLSRLGDLMVFVAVSGAARLGLALERSNAPAKWERDLTSRQQEATP